MTATSCNMASDVFTVCLTHALSTEREEVMGLLLGEVDDATHSVHISSLVVLQRSDKRPDRVEISPEQLTDAAMFADNLAHTLNRPMRVVGWYHSHPHITVWPSHIDVRTQAAYQMMDTSFVGVIFSVFNTDKQTKESQIQVTCFQSEVQSNRQPVEYYRREIPFHLEKKLTFEDHNIDSLISLPQVLLSEEKIAYESAKSNSLVTQIRNSAVYTQSVCQILDTLVAPLMLMLENRLAQNQQTKLRLQHEKQTLEEQLQEQEQQSNVKNLKVNECVKIL